MYMHVGHVIVSKCFRFLALFKLIELEINFAWFQRSRTTRGGTSGNKRRLQIEMFRHADVVCLCLVCILWQFSMLRSA